MSGLPVSFVLLAIAAVAFAIHRYTNRPRYKLPPGPKGIPFFGNIFQVPKSNEWETYAKWGKQYNTDLLYLNFAGQPAVVVQSAQAAYDLFEKRSSLYSDRVDGVMVNDMLGWKFNIVFMQYGDRWRDTRRAFHQWYNSGQVPKYHPRIVKYSRKMLSNLLDTPDEFMGHLRQMTGSLIMRLTYGIDVKEKNDPFIMTAENALQTIAHAGNANSQIVDWIPSLRHLPAWLPGLGFKRYAEKHRPWVDAMNENPHNAVKEALAKGTANNSMLTMLLSRMEEKNENPANEDIYRDAAGTAYTGGADTTVSALGTFLLAMVLYPDVQKKAQEEIDRVIGRDRLPEFEDEASLPYVSALVKEAMRWQQVTPLAVPHRLTQDDEYMGYTIPAGTIVIGNAWAILHDERRYPQPDRFWPERFLTADGKLNPSAPDPLEAAFGFGRRICPGKTMAMADVWFTALSVLSAFTISKPLDAAGNPIVPKIAYTPGLLSYPQPFKAEFKPRFAGAEQLIRLANEASEV